MALTPKEESLITIFRVLSLDEADKILNWARQLVDLADGRPIEWSDTWTNADLVDATAVAVRRFEDHERETR